MSYELTNQQKIDTINQHLKSLNFSRYELEISLLEAVSGGSPDQESIDNLQQKIEVIVAQKEALNLEMSLLTD